MVLLNVKGKGKCWLTNVLPQQGTDFDQIFMKNYTHYLVYVVSHGALEDI